MQKIDILDKESKEERKIIENKDEIIPFYDYKISILFYIFLYLQSLVELLKIFLKLLESLYIPSNLLNLAIIF